MEIQLCLCWILVTSTRTCRAQIAGWGGAVFACDSNIRFRFGDTHFTDSKLTVIN